MPAFALAIFLSAFLLFQVQPLVARFILPWYGGGPAVWTACMLFFQAGLLVGYAYAHALATWLRDRPSWQCAIHGGLLMLSLLSLPVMPSESWRPSVVVENPVPGILLLLARTVGLPYVVVSASGPLLQHWFARANPGISPYRLYAVSNAGSLLGLLSYPVLIEPSLRLAPQSWLWSGGYVVYGGLVALCAAALLKHRGVEARPEAAAAPAETGGTRRAPWFDRVLWVALSACGSILLLATTNQMCQDVAVVPFLWVLPLSLYLVTFIIAFDREGWYRRWLWVPLALVFAFLVMRMIHRSSLNQGLDVHFTGQVAIYCLTLFLGCLVCHGELVRLRPAREGLTGFYLAVSLGGAIGGVFVGLAAPALFAGIWEYFAGLGLLAVVTVICLLRGIRETPAFSAIMATFVTAGFAGHLLCTQDILKREGDDVVARARNFYGLLRVKEYTKSVGGRLFTTRMLVHGRISHGQQYPDSEYQKLPTTYYCPGSGPDALFSTHPSRLVPSSPGPLRYGVIGLGTGTLAAYAKEGDYARMYEINPAVADLAEKRFTYLSDCAGKVEVALGDARVSLARELETTGSQRFDFLFVDAFSGDAIPVHLITREACELYFQHLKPDGVLAVHTTNTHLDLTDPVRTLARDMGLDALQVEHRPEGEGSETEDYSQWVLLGRNPALFKALREAGWETEWPREARDIRWTDDFSNLWDVLLWKK